MKRSLLVFASIWVTVATANVQQHHHDNDSLVVITEASKASPEKIHDGGSERLVTANQDYILSESILQATKRGFLGTAARLGEHGPTSTVRMVDQSATRLNTISTSSTRLHTLQNNPGDIASEKEEKKKSPSRQRIYPSPKEIMVKRQVDVVARVECNPRSEDTQSCINTKEYCQRSFLSKAGGVCMPLSKDSTVPRSSRQLTATMKGLIMSDESHSYALAPQQDGRKIDHSKAKRNHLDPKHALLQPNESDRVECNPMSQDSKVDAIPPCDHVMPIMENSTITTLGRHLRSSWEEPTSGAFVNHSWMGLYVVTVVVSMISWCIV